MLELTGVAGVLRGISILYWLLSIGVLALVLWKVERWWGKAIGALIVMAVFGYLPAQDLIEVNKREAYAREAWAYFKKKCEAESGEKIYKTFTGVKSVLVVKPLPPATEKDNYDQFWYGDPYSASVHSQRGRLEAAILASPDAPVSAGQAGRGLDFVESMVPAKEGESKTIIKYYYPKGARDHLSQIVEHSVSRFGISWEDISTPEDRKYWVAGSRLRVIDLSNNNIVAERIGYLIETGFGSNSGQRRPWLSARGLGQNGRSCPDAHDYSDRWFLLKVLKPTEGAENAK